jgi:hypothetical protein
MQQTLSPTAHSYIVSNQGLEPMRRSARLRFPFLVVFPQARRETWWVRDMAAQALQALAQTVTEGYGDPPRLSLSGVSMGGSGTWDVAARVGGRCAALVPVCGGVSLRRADLPAEATPMALSLEGTLTSTEGFVLDRVVLGAGVSEVFGPRKVWLPAQRTETFQGTSEYNTAAHTGEGSPNTLSGGWSVPCREALPGEAPPRCQRQDSTPGSAPRHAMACMRLRWYASCTDGPSERRCDPGWCRERTVLAASGLTTRVAAPAPRRDRRVQRTTYRLERCLRNTRGSPRKEDVGTPRGGLCHNSVLCQPA